LFDLLLFIFEQVISILPLKMANKDPFDKVLEKLGLYQRIQGVSPIRTAAVPAALINALEVPCRTQGIVLSFIADDVPSEVREALALKLIKSIHPPRESSTVRPISLILDLDGTVQAEPMRMVRASKGPGFLSGSIPHPYIHDM
jgi:hypothetical protein